MDARTGIGSRLFVLCPWVRAAQVAGVFDPTSLARLGSAEDIGSGGR